MKFEVTCPGCRKTLRCDGRLVGEQISCPICKQRFRLRPPEHPPAEEQPLDVVPVEEAPIDVLPIEEEPIDVSPVEEEPIDVSPLEEEAIREGRPEKRRPADPEEAAPQYVSSRAEAEELLAEWEAELPEVESEYRPSGALPGSARMALSVGALAGASVGALAGAIAGVVLTGLAIATFYLAVFGLGLGIIWCAALPVLAIFTLLAFVGAFGLPGWVAAVLTTRFARWGKNRNVEAAVLLSSISAGLAVLLAWAVFFLGRPVVLEQLGAGGGADGFDPVAVVSLVVALLGGVFAVLVTRRVGAGRVRSAKSCEDCERHMTQPRLKRFRLGGLRAFTEALDEGEGEVAAGLLHSPASEDGDVVLFACPRCGKGYVEATVRFKVYWWGRRRRDSKKESWLVASVELTWAQVEAFRACMGER